MARFVTVRTPSNEIVRLKTLDIPADGWHDLPLYTPPGWVAGGSVPQYMKDSEGWVNFRGWAICPGGGGGTTLATLSGSYWPKFNVALMALTDPGGVSIIQVATTGVVTVTGGNSSALLTLDGLRFSTT